MPLIKKCAHASTGPWCLPHAPSQAASRSRIWCFFPRSLGRCKTVSLQSWQDMGLHFIFNYRSSVSFNFDFLGSSLYTLQTFLSKFPIYIYPVFKVWIGAKKVCVNFFFLESMALNSYVPSPRLLQSSDFRLGDQHYESALQTFSLDPWEYLEFNKW